MKKLLLVVALLAVSFNSHAGWRGNQGATALAGAIAGANAGATSDASGGNATGGNVDIKQRRQWPNGTAIGAASSNTTAAHRFLDSHSTSVLFVARSRTQMLFDVVSFTTANPLVEIEGKEGLHDTQATLAACWMEPTYAEFRDYMGVPCPAK